MSENSCLLSHARRVSSVLIAESWGGSLSNRDISMLRRCDKAQFESIWLLQTSSLACNGDQASVLLSHLLGFRGKGACWRCSAARVLPVSLMPGSNEPCIMPQLAEAWSWRRIPRGRTRFCQRLVWMSVYLSPDLCVWCFKVRIVTTQENPTHTCLMSCYYVTHIYEHFISARRHTAEVHIVVLTHWNEKAQTNIKCLSPQLQRAVYLHGNITPYSRRGAAALTFIAAHKTTCTKPIWMNYIGWVLNDSIGLLVKPGNVTITWKQLINVY